MGKAIRGPTPANMESDEACSNHADLPRVFQHTGRAAPRSFRGAVGRPWLNVTSAGTIFLRARVGATFPGARQATGTKAGQPRWVPKREIRKALIHNALRIAESFKRRAWDPIKVI